MIIKAKKIFCMEKKNSDVFIEARSGIIYGIHGDLRIAAEEFHDYSECCVAPLLCDYHLHIAGRSLSSIDSLKRQLLNCGIGAAYDGGDRAAAGIAARQVMHGLPLLKTAGYAIFKAGGYGSAIGKGITTVEEAGLVINELTSSGVDYIKVINSGIFDPAKNSLTAGGFLRDELARIVDYSREKGLNVFCHANGDRPVRDAVDAGVSAVIHGLWVSDETLCLMSEKGVSFIPTLFAFRSLKNMASGEQGIHNVERAVFDHMKAVNRAAALGVKIYPGSDSGPSFLSFGSSFIEELRLLIEAGISFEDVIRSASAGHLKEGGPANFIILDNLIIRAVVLQGQFLMKA